MASIAAKSPFAGRTCRSESGVRRVKAAFLSGCESHPAILLQPEAIGDPASVQAVTRVNAEQSSKRTLHRPTCSPMRGRLIGLEG